jgi:hypothetical protein
MRKSLRIGCSLLLGPGDSLNSIGQSMLFLLTRRNLSENVFPCGPGTASFVAHATRYSHPYPHDDGLDE